MEVESSPLTLRIVLSISAKRNDERWGHDGENPVVHKHCPAGYPASWKQNRKSNRQPSLGKSRSGIGRAGIPTLEIGPGSCTLRGRKYFRAFDGQWGAIGPRSLARQPSSELGSVTSLMSGCVLKNLVSAFGDHGGTLAAEEHQASSHYRWSTARR